MYEQSGCFNPNAMRQGPRPSEDCFSQIVSDPPPPVMAGTATETHKSFAENVGLSVEKLSYPACGEDARVAASATAMEILHQQEMVFKLENSYNNSNNFNTHLAEEVNLHDSSLAISFDQSNWDTNIQGIYQSHHNQNLLNLLHLPISLTSSAVNSSISFANPTQNTTYLQSPSGLIGYKPVGEDSRNVSSVLYDPFLHSNLPAHPPAIKELRHSLPHGYTLPAASRNDFVFGGGDDREGSTGAAYYDNGVLEFTQELASVGKKRGGKRINNKQFTTEKQRRVDLSSKFDDLKELIPNHTKNDKASVVGDAIEYIRELLRTVNELKLLVNKKRCGKEMIKRHKVEKDASGSLESCNLKPIGNQDNSLNGCLRSSWLQRKTKETVVDVRIIDNEVTIKLVRRKKINCLLYASKVLDELELDLQHVAGGHIGDFCSFFFNSKISEGSSVYASAIANKLIEVLDRNFAAA